MVRERIAAGDSDAQVLDFLVARFGEFVLLKPRLNSHTYLLWLLPPLGLIAGGTVLWLFHRRRMQAAKDEQEALTLTPEEEARLERLLATEFPPQEAK